MAEEARAGGDAELVGRAALAGLGLREGRECDAGGGGVGAGGRNDGLRVGADEDAGTWAGVGA